MSERSEVSLLLSMKVDEIEEALGVAITGMDSADEAMNERNFLFSIAGEQNPQSANRFLATSLRARAIRYFDYVWGKLESILCHLYNNGMPEGRDDDLVGYIADLIIALLKIPKGIAILIAILIVKRGLDKLCRVKMA